MRFEASAILRVRGAAGEGRQSSPHPNPLPKGEGIKGFTLVELLVVMAIIVLVIAVGLPSVSAMLGSGRVENARGDAASAVRAARLYATRERRGFERGEFSGAAALFTPAGEIRLVENVDDAVDGSNEFLETKGANGYADIEGQDYVNLPREAGVVGIARGNDGLELFAPPFAIRFKSSGVMVAGVTNNGGRLVYYDGDYDGQYLTSTERPNGYDPAPFDPTSPEFDADLAVAPADDPSYNVESDKYIVPFEAIETVIGVIVFDKSAFWSAGYSMAQDELDDFGRDSEGQPDSAGAWIQDNGSHVLFNRYTGTVVQP